MNIKQEQFDNQRLVENLKKDDINPKVIVDNMCCAVSDFTQNAEQSDDITMLCIKYNG
jgi:serine phosphatase RsbU (regulator of sigma subunit)